MSLAWIITGLFVAFVGAFALSMLMLGVLVAADLVYTTFRLPE